MAVRLSQIRSVAKTHGMVYIDQAIYSATNAATLILGARTLTGGQLSNLAIQIFISLGFVLFQRASMINPAMVAQRVSGPCRIPLRWILLSGTALSLVTLALSVALGRLIGVSDAKSAVILSSMTLFLCLQDGLRYWAISSGKAVSAVFGDTAWCLMMAVIYLSRGNGEWRTLTFIEITAVCAGTSALVIWCLGVGRGRGPYASLRTTWRLGRWGSLTSLSSTIGVLLPLVVASSVVNPAVAGLYRTLQTVLGPLGVLATSVSTSLLSRAWLYQGPDGVKRLQQTVRHYSIGLLVFSTVYLGAGVVIVIMVTGISLGTLWYVPVVVVVGGILGSPVTPLSSGSLILGKQKKATQIALTIVASTVVVTVLSAVGPLSGRFDPVAVATVGAGATGVLWWISVFRDAVAHEVRSSDNSPVPTLSVKGSGPIAS